jgi:hypothetical protein
VQAATLSQYSLLAAAAAASHALELSGAGSGVHMPPVSTPGLPLLFMDLFVGESNCVRMKHQHPQQ